jgi:hypothetical protein
MTTPARQAKNSKSASTEVAAFIDKFEPTTAALIRSCRARLRKLLPGAFELVYDNYNFFVIGYAPTERASDCIVSLAAAANGVILSFYRGASLPDSQGVLLGNGKQNRFVRLPTSTILVRPDVLALIRAAVAQSKTPIPDRGATRTIIKSISAKQRPRRKKTRSLKPHRP